MLPTAELLPPTGRSTLGFDPARFPAEPPACSRASWQLLGRDSHPLATTSLCWINSHQAPPTLGARTIRARAQRDPARDDPLAVAPRTGRAAAGAGGDGRPGGAFGT